MDFELAKAYRDLDVAWDRMNVSYDRVKQEEARIEEEVQQRYTEGRPVLKGDNLEFRRLQALAGDDVLPLYAGTYRFFVERVRIFTDAIRLSNEQKMLDNQAKIIDLLDDIRGELRRL